MLNILKPLSQMRSTAVGLLAAASLLFAPVALAFPVLTPVTWSLSGPGILTTTQAGNLAQLNYNLDPAGNALNTWTASATASIAGDYMFAWQYNGFHGFNTVTAFLSSSVPTVLINAGPVSCCVTPYAGFSYAGLYTFMNVGAANTFGFTFGGSNQGDGTPFNPDTNLLNGTLILMQVPEPGSLALLGFGLGLAGFVATRRRKQV